MSNVLSFIDRLASQSAIVIRHAERHEICSADDYWTCGLTDKGNGQARDFGLAISEQYDSYRLFYSPVERCQQTAMGIASSLEDSGKGILAIGPERQLSVLSYMYTDEVRGFKEADRFGRDFIRAWFDGRVDRAVYKPLHETRDEHLAYLEGKLATANDKRHLDIHVTHDWNICVLREGIFGLRHEDAGWPGFLSGLGFIKEPFAAMVDNGADPLKKKLA